MKVGRRAHAALVMIALVLVPAFGHAGIQVCKDANGHKVYSDIPCGPDAKPVQVKPASGGLEAAPYEQLKVEYYEIRGNSWPALKRQIDSKGPEGWWGVTNSVTRYAVKPRLTEAGCVADDVVVESDARVLLPDWADRYAGPRKLQLQWDNVVRTLDLHERGHVQINLEGSREVERALKTIPPQPSCDALRAEVKRRYEEIRAEVNRRQRDYDEDNQHGLRQWTPYHD